MCLGSALDILEAGRPPRATFLDYPLGHSAGKPFAPDEQASVIRSSLQGLTTLQDAGAIQTLPLKWYEDEAWRLAASSSEGADTRQARDESPQFQSPGDREAAIESGAFAG